MNRSSLNQNDHRDERIKELERELYFTQSALIESLPEEVSQVLRSYYSCVSVEESYGWIDGVADDLVRFAKVVPRGHYDLTDRAPCPLCDAIPQSFTPESGYVVPGGLIQHFLGTGNAHQCSFVSVANSMANRHWDEQFGGPRGTLKRQQYEEMMKQRRGTELQYIVDPYALKRLVDEGVGMSRRVRDENGLKWAEQRLDAMGFQKNLSSKVVSYTKEYQMAMVYADPRKPEVISFSIVLKPVHSDVHSSHQRRFLKKHYVVQDRWKNDLSTKLEKAVEVAVKEMIPPPEIAT